MYYIYIFFVFITDLLIDLVFVLHLEYYLYCSVPPKRMQSPDKETKIKAAPTRIKIT